MKKVLIMVMLSLVILCGCGGGGGGSAVDTGGGGGGDLKVLEYYTGTFGSAGQIAFTLNTQTDAVSGYISRNNMVHDFNGTVTDDGQLTVSDVSYDNNLQLSLSIDENGSLSGTWSDNGSNGSVSGDRVHVTGNQPPVIIGWPSTEVFAETAYIFTPYAMDPDGDTVTFSISNKPSWLNFNTSTGALYGTPLTPGVFSNIVISAHDGKGGTNSLSPLTITVTEPVATSANFTRDANTNIVTNLHTGLKWQDDAVRKMSWYDAGTYCNNLSFQGLTDWRLPNRAELLTLVDNTRPKNPYIDVVFANLPIGFAGYWTSEEQNADDAYYYNFGTGGAMSYVGKTQTAIYVRCVHD